MTKFAYFTFLASVTGQSLSIKPNKVVAGLEANYTNEFLQALAEAINKKVKNNLVIVAIVYITVITS